MSLLKVTLSGHAENSRSAGNSGQLHKEGTVKGILTTFKLGMQILILKRLIFLPMFKRYMKKRCLIKGKATC